MTEHESSPGLQDNTELLHRISARLSDRFAGIGEAVTVYSAGTRPDKSLNPQAVASLTELGIEGMERMRLVRDDIRTRVQKLHAELTGN